MKSIPIKTSIIIITRNQKEYLEQSLPMIFDQTIKEIEVIVVDSGSTDGALEFLRHYPVKVIHYSGPTGKDFNYPRAFNLGAEAAKGEFLVRLSGDVIPANQFWLENLLEPLETSLEVVGVYSRQAYEPWADWSHRLLCFCCFSQYRRIFKKISLNLMFWGAACALRKELYQKMPFDYENYRIAEDCRWSVEVNKLGFKTIYASDSLVFHNHIGKFQWRSFFRSEALKTVMALYFDNLVWALGGKKHELTERVKDGIIRIRW